VCVEWVGCGYRLLTVVLGLGEEDWSPGHADVKKSLCRLLLMLHLININGWLDGGCVFWMGWDRQQRMHCLRCSTSLHHHRDWLGVDKQVH